MPDAAQHAAQWISILPLTFVAVASMLGRRVGWRLRLISVALALTTAYAMVAKTMYDAGTPNLWLSYVLAPVQFGLLLAVVVPRSTRVAFPLFLVLVAVSLGRATWGVPENVITVVAGGAVVGCLVAYPLPGARYKWGLLLYCAGTVPGLLALAYIVDSSSWNVGYTTAWVGYHAARAVALLMLAYAALTQPRMQTEVARGGTGRASARQVRPVRRDVADARVQRPAGIT